MSAYLSTIEHQGVVLRPWQAQDASAFEQAALESLATVGQWMDWCSPHYTVLDAHNWVQHCHYLAQQRQAYEVGIFCQTSGQLLGGAGLNRIDHDNRVCNLGYWVRQSAQRQGVARRSVQALVQHAFSALGMQRVEIVAAQGNHASEAVARHAGAVQECLARNRLQLRGSAVAAQVFSIVPSELQTPQ